MVQEWWVLLPLAFVAGMVDAAVGGGGLIQLPALFAALPQAAPVSLLGSNKFASIFGTGSACWRYARQLQIPWRLLLLVGSMAFACSFAGARVASLVPVGAFKLLVLLFLLLMLAYTLWRKDFGQQHRPVHLSWRQWLLGGAIGGAIGFYDGFLGPGTGSFLIFLFVRCFGFDFLRASAAAKVVNLCTNVAALAFFIPAGHVLYIYALPMACCNMLGAQLGARLALRGGASVVRSFFIAIVLLLIGKLAMDVVG